MHVFIVFEYKNKNISETMHNSLNIEIEKDLVLINCLKVFYYYQQCYAFYLGIIDSLSIANILPGSIIMKDLDVGKGFSLVEFPTDK